ncbi:SPOSA6832_00852 [Sporobolomyces salmonicolor]|uniref:SPOSA6832_00852-mRNA-1:cds n=1 Tax=Sporidiobolus salmonicolor TaxID=5005 RepID=A0A0D6EHU5_SPOSA|nr:SPOSA6832_00852 [Sporobolomyces salmonicolor]
MAKRHRPSLSNAPTIAPTVELAPDGDLQPSIKKAKQRDKKRKHKHKQDTPASTSADATAAERGQDSVDADGAGGEDAKTTGHPDQPILTGHTKEAKAPRKAAETAAALRTSTPAAAPAYAEELDENAHHGATNDEDHEEQEQQPARKKAKKNRDKETDSSTKSKKSKKGKMKDKKRFAEAQAAEQEQVQSSAQSHPMDVDQLDLSRDGPALSAAAIMADIHRSNQPDIQVNAYDPYPTAAPSAYFLPAYTPVASTSTSHRHHTSGDIPVDPVLLAQSHAPQTRPQATIQPSDPSIRSRTQSIDFRSFGLPTEQEASTSASQLADRSTSVSVPGADARQGDPVFESLFDALQGAGVGTPAPKREGEGEEAVAEGNRKKKKKKSAEKKDKKEKKDRKSTKEAKGKDKDQDKEEAKDKKVKSYKSKKKVATISGDDADGDSDGEAVGKELPAKAAPLDLNIDDDEEIERPVPRTGAFWTQLQTKWMPVKELKQLAADHNATYKLGKFSASEDKLIEHTLRAYRAQHGLTQDELVTLLTTKRDLHKAAPFAANEAWQQLGRVLVERPLLAIYNHVKRLYSPDAKRGKWTGEEDEALRAAVKQWGNSWEKIAQLVGRTGGDCRDRWTKQLSNGAESRHGKWSVEEEDQLRSLQAKHGNSWKVISEKMGGVRTPTQCRIKWKDFMVRRDNVKDAVFADPTEKEAWRWKRQNTSTLIHVVADLAVHDESEIDWKLIDEPSLAMHGPKNLRDRFRFLMKNAAKEIREKEGLPEEAKVPYKKVLALVLTQFPERGKAPRKSYAQSASGKRAAGRAKSAAEVVSEDESSDEGDEDEDEDDHVAFALGALPDLPVPLGVQSMVERLNAQMAGDLEV